jgi:hypothetical protein
VISEFRELLEPNKKGIQVVLGGFIIGVAAFFGSRACRITNTSGRLDIDNISFVVPTVLIQAPEISSGIHTIRSMLLCPAEHR